MQYEAFRDIIAKLVRERHAQGINTERDRGSKLPPQIFIVYSSEQPPEMLDEIDDHVWEFASVGKVVNVLALLLEKANKAMSVPAPDDYYGIAVVSEAWSRQDVSMEEARDATVMPRPGDITADPTSVSVIMGSAYSPRDGQQIFLSMTEDGNLRDYVAEVREFDPDGEGVFVGAIPEATRRLGDAMLGSSDAE